MGWAYTIEILRFRVEWYHQWPLLLHICVHIVMVNLKRVNTTRGKPTKMIRKSNRTINPNEEVRDAQRPKYIKVRTMNEQKR
jgi:hypothetical protein